MHSSGNLEFTQQRSLGLSVLCGSEAPRHHPKRCDVNPRTGAFRVSIVLFRESSFAVEPAERSLDHPPLRNDFKPFGGIAAQYDLDCDSELGLDCCERWSTVATIDEDLL